MKVTFKLTSGKKGDRKTGSNLKFLPVCSSSAESSAFSELKYGDWIKVFELVVILFDMKANTVYLTTFMKLQ